MFKKKDTAIPWDKYFMLVKPKYVYLKVKPHKSTRNYNSTNIAKAIQNTYKAITKRVRIEQKKLWLETDFKISYVIDIKDKNSSFYFIIPEVYTNIIVEKIREIWPKVELTKTDPIESFSDNTIYYQLNYKKEDALAIQVDKKSNEPLNSILSVMEIMQDGDRVTIIYNFIPSNHMNWQKRYTETMDKIKDLKPVEKDRTSMQYMIKTALSFVNYVFNSILEVLNDFAGSEKKVNTVLSELLLTTDILEVNKRWSDETKLKKERTVLNTQILIASSSADVTRLQNNASVVCQSYRVLDEDNELISKRVNTKGSEGFDIESCKFKNVGINAFSVNECQNFIQQPGRLLMKALGISYTEVEEVNVPIQLQKGYISLGDVSCKGNKQTAYIEDKYDKTSLPLVEIGAQGAGKSTFIANYYRFAAVRKEGGVVIDFIKNCEMSEEVISYLSPEDRIILDYTKESDIQGFAFNEFQFKEGMNTFERLELTNLQAQQVLTFVDSINPEQPLQARMRKYLSAAANVVFATGETSLKEVVNCLEDHQVRFFYINELNGEEKEYLQEEIKNLGDLNEYSKVTKENPIAELIGTKESKIEGIMDRISLLREDFKLKYMFNKGSKGNINFAKELEAGKVIIIRMPQASYKKHAKNVVGTFLLSKIWIATEIRGKWNKKPKPTHISVDEIFQAKTAMRMLANDEILPQTRKFGCKFIFSCQYTEQIDILMDTLIGAGASFMLMKGTSEKDFKRFESQLEGFEYEDLKDMEDYSSMNLIYYSGGYSGFISQLPAPIK